MSLSRERLKVMVPS